MSPRSILLLVAIVTLVPLAVPARASGLNGTPGSRVPWPRPEQPDPLYPLLRRIDRYFVEHEIDGVTLDSRYPINPSEAIRMSVVSQLLGYAELYRTHPSDRLRAEIAGHADFLMTRIDSISSHTPFDGMLVYAILGAYETTGDPRYLTTGTTLVQELEAIPTSECVLNGGLMVAMATAEYARLTGQAAADQKTRDILSLLPPYQNADGSFPHWCYGSEDIHYTGWMSQELVLIERTLPDARIAPILARMEEFMDGRVDSTGWSSYEEPCPGVTGCWLYFDSRRSGCSIDYDTRGWTVEPAYNALLFDRFHAPKYDASMRHLLALESGGTFADKWDFIPPPDDPEYPWSIADTSVANTSIIFWTLATIDGGRHARFDDPSAWEDDPGAGGGPASSPPAPAASLTLGPFLAERGSEAIDVHFAIPAPASVSLAIFDVAGRRLRDLVAAPLGPGEHVARWDRRDQAGASVRSGMYFVRLSAGEAARAGRVLVVR